MEGRRFNRHCSRHQPRGSIAWRGVERRPSKRARLPNACESRGSGAARLESTTQTIYRRHLMHRYFGRFVMAAGALLMAATAQAQGTSAVTRNYKFGGDLGAAVPLGDFGDGANVGYHIGGLFEYTPKSMPVSWRGEMAYNRNGLKDTGIAGVDGNFSMFNIVGNAVMPFGDKAANIRPYAITGLGIYRVKASAEYQGVTASQSDTKLGLNAGAGLSFHLSGFETFVET